MIQQKSQPIEDRPPPPTDRQDGKSFREVFDLREWLRVCSAHFWWLVIITMAVFAGTAITTLTATRYYRATQRILIERDSDKVLKVPETYDVGSQADDYYLTQYKLLESRAIAEAALALLPEADRAWFERDGDPVRRFMRLRKIVPIRKSRLVDIHAEHPLPKVAEFMVTSIHQAYVQNAEGRRRESAFNATKKLREDQRTLKARLIEARRISQEYKTEHGILTISDRQTLPEFRLQTLNQELASIERELSDSDARLASASKAIRNADFTSDLPEVLKNEVVSQFKMAYLDARSTLSRLTEKYKDKHPRVVEYRSKVDSITQQINREVLAVFGALRHENERIRKHKTDIEARIVKQNQLLFEQERHRNHYEQLVQEAETTQKMYETVADRLKEVEVIEDYATSNVHAVGPPVVPKQPIRPQPVAAISIALLAGLLLSIIVAFVLDAMDNSLKSATEAEQLLGVPVVGVVPRVRGGRSQVSVDQKSLDPESSVAEAFRSIRTNLLLSNAADRLNSVVVTSTGASEGKSLVAMNLATSFARAGHRVLLVDAEMRRPRLHNALNIHCVEGFSSVLIGDRKVEQVAFETDEDNLFFMPCGVLPPNPLELLTIGMSTKVRRDLAEFFDLVVFDSPPVGIVSDACMLAAAADQVLFVIRTFAADRQQSQRAIQNLRNTGARIGGLIVNHVDSKAERGRQLDFTYDSNYASMPSVVVDDPDLLRAEAEADFDLDDKFDLQLVELEEELESAISNLTRETQELPEEE